MRVLRTVLVAGTLILAPASLAPAESGSVVQGSLGPTSRGKVQFVYVDHADGVFAPKPAVMNQRSNTYSPHLLLVLVGAQVEFRSEDPDIHNVFARGADHHVLFNQAVLPHQHTTSVFAKPGVVKLTCNVHKGMLAFIAVMQNPYWAVPDAEGRWKILGLPPGHYQVRVWGETLDDATLAKSTPLDVDAASPQPMNLQIAAN